MPLSPPQGKNARFASTRWTVVLSASAPGSPEAAAALDALCQTYWYPLYAYVRRRGHSTADAQDLTQEFFAQLLEHNWVARAQPEKGRFRSFLLMALKRFLANEWDKATSIRRGGRVHFVPLPFDTAEARYEQIPASDATPDQLFDREWAQALLNSVLAALQEDYRAQGKPALFEALKSCLIGSRELQPYAGLAEQLGMSEAAIKVAVHRMRHRYRKRLKAEIAETVANASDVEDELRHLIRAMARE
ncbi:MAG: hypothetical protein AMXMBFR84_20350 [Candidatus Hydrogenedentota bacterium]